MKLFHTPLTRSVRILWLFEELGLPYELETVETVDPVARPFVQKTPTGKVPTLEDDGLVMFESGAIIEYVLERYGEGRLAPAPGDARRGEFLQWMHFAESTAMAGLGPIIWHTRFRENAAEIPSAIADYRGWTDAAFDVLERTLTGREHLLGEFSAADIMVGYTALAAKSFDVLGERPALEAYLGRLTARPALQKALTR